MTKDLGFNMIRKHVKVEPARWYYHAIALGMLVWQDMPSADNKDEDAKANFARELKAEIDNLRNHPAIVMWVPFNEGWGQHDTEQTVAWIKSYDPSRLVNNTSGWTDTGVGDVADLHAYPGPGDAAARARACRRRSASSAGSVCRSTGTPGSIAATGGTAPSPPSTR